MIVFPEAHCFVNHLFIYLYFANCMKNFFFCKKHFLKAGSFYLASLMLFSSCNSGNKVVSSFGKRKYTKGFFFNVPSIAKKQTSAKPEELVNIAKTGNAKTLIKAKNDGREATSLIVGLTAKAQNTNGSRELTKSNGQKAIKVEKFIIERGVESFSQKYAPAIDTAKVSTQQALNPQKHHWVAKIILSVIGLSALIFGIITGQGYVINGYTIDEPTPIFISLLGLLVIVIAFTLIGKGGSPNNQNQYSQARYTDVPFHPNADMGRSYDAPAHNYESGGNPTQNHTNGLKTAGGVILVILGILGLIFFGSAAIAFPSLWPFAVLALGVLIGGILMSSYH